MVVDVAVVAVMVVYMVKHGVRREKERGGSGGGGDGSGGGGGGGGGSGRETRGDIHTR